MNVLPRIKDPQAYGARSYKPALNKGSARTRHSRCFRQGVRRRKYTSPAKFNGALSSENGKEAVRTTDWMVKVTRSASPVFLVLLALQPGRLEAVHCLCEARPWGAFACSLLAGESYASSQPECQ